MQSLFTSITKYETSIINNLNEVKQKVTQNSVNEEIEFGLDSKILDF